MPPNSGEQPEPDYDDTEQPEEEPKPEAIDPDAAVVLPKPPTKDQIAGAMREKLMRKISG